jgi:hypothetical protein
MPVVVYSVKAHLVRALAHICQKRLKALKPGRAAANPTALVILCIARARIAYTLLHVEPAAIGASISLGLARMTVRTVESSRDFTPKAATALGVLAKVHAVDQLGVAALARTKPDRSLAFVAHLPYQGQPTKYIPWLALV